MPLEDAIGARFSELNPIPNETVANRKIAKLALHAASNRRGALNLLEWLLRARILNGTTLSVIVPREGPPSCQILVPEAGYRDDIREIILQGYRIIYQITADGIYILAVIHGSPAVRFLDGLGACLWHQ